jgi:RNA polymerase sigma-70 factor (ECF subfamily)
MNLDQLAAAACHSQTDLGQLYELLYPRVYNYVRYRCEDQAVTEDLVSQIFERLLAALGTYDRGRGPFEAWVFAIARNRVTSHYRTRALRTFLPWEWFHQAADPSPLPEETALLHETEAALLAALLHLKPQQRDLLGLKYSSGLSNPQIAALTGLSESNVAVTLHRAVEALRQILNPAAVDDSGRPCQKEAEHAKE